MWLGCCSTPEFCQSSRASVPCNSAGTSHGASFQRGRFIEVHVATTLEVCEERDPKGLYRKARAGELAGLTGVSSPFEPPEHAEVAVPSGEPVDEAVERILLWRRQLS